MLSRSFLQPECTYIGNHCPTGKGGQISTEHLKTSIHPFSRPVAYPVYTNKKCVIETGTLFWGRTGNNGCIGLDYSLTVTMRNTHLLHRSRKLLLSFYLYFFWVTICLSYNFALPPLPLCVGIGCVRDWDGQVCWSTDHRKSPEFRFAHLVRNKCVGFPVVEQLRITQQNFSKLVGQIKILYEKTII